MLKRSLQCLAALIVFCTGPAHATVINSINISTVSGYTETYFPGDFNRFGLLGVPLTYALDNGELRVPGAGWIPYTNGTVTRQTIVGDTIEYESGSIYNWALGDGVLFYHVGQVWDYTSDPNYWSEGTLIPASPLILRGSLGGNVATLTGFARIFFNNASNMWGDPAEFFPYAAPEGALVPFSATYTLLDATWNLDVFDQPFNYQMEGVIDFTAASVSEPGGLALALLGAVVLAGAGRFHPCRRRQRPNLTDVQYGSLGGERPEAAAVDWCRSIYPSQSSFPQPSGARTRNRRLPD
jgi:hypothetical protein